MKSRSAAVAKRQLPRLAIDATPYNYQHIHGPSPSSSVSSAQASIATSVDTPFSAGIFPVLCLYDYDAVDPEQLTFRKNEVLDIVKIEQSGWWAAVRPSDGTVGWIPSAYVDAISESTAERLRAREHKIHIQVNTERLNPPIADERSPYALGSATDGIRGYEWMPLTDTSKKLSHLVSPIRIPNDVTTSAIDSPLILHGEDPYSAAAQFITIPDTARIRAACPPSPLTPMPKPPLHVSVNNGPRSAPIRSSTAHFPQSPTPTKSPAVHTRQLRRRPVFIDDSTSLSRLSTLFESSNVAEVDFLANSPVVAESIDAYPRIARHSVDKVKQITGDDDAQALYSARVAQNALPWFLKPDHGEGEIKVEYDGAITAGTLPALVERLTFEHFTPALERQYRYTFFMTYPTFTTADEVFDLLLSFYHMKPPPGLDAEETEQWKQKRLGTAQKRVLTVFSIWLEQHRMVDFEPPTAQKLQAFLSSITGPTGNKVTAKQVMKSLERMTFIVSPDPFNNSAPAPTKHRRWRTSRDDLFKVDATILAEHLCMYERKLYGRVRPQDCLEYVKRQNGGTAERLVSFCKTHDRLANWIKSSILTTESVGKRAHMIDMWIKVAEKCRALNGYSSLSAIIAALTSTVLTRLRMTWAHVDRADHLEALSTFNDPLSSFAHYRTAQQEAAEDACVPFIGMYLTDLMHLNEQFPDTTSEGLINFMKRHRCGEVVDTILRHQGMNYPFADTEDPGLLSFIDESLQQAADKDDTMLWNISQEVSQSEVQQTDIRKGLEAAGF